MKKSLGCLVFGLSLFLTVQPVFAQTNLEYKLLQKEIESIKEGQDGIRKDIQELKKLVQGIKQAPAAPGGEFKEAVIDIKGAPIKGDKNAKLVLLEFADYQWPFCARHVRETGPQIDKEYIETGKLRHVFMDFPLDMHKNAFKASVAGLCAGDQGKFWEMNHKLFENSSALEPDKLGKYAESVGLNMTAFTSCLDSGKHDAAIKARMTEGQSKAGITGTPAFLLGYIQPNGTVKATKKIVGAGPFSNFKTAIDELLSKK